MISTTTMPVLKWIIHDARKQGEYKTGVKLRETESSASIYAYMLETYGHIMEPIKISDSVGVFHTERCYKPERLYTKWKPQHSRTTFFNIDLQSNN